DGLLQLHVNVDSGRNRTRSERAPCDETRRSIRAFTHDGITGTVGTAPRKPEGSDRSHCDRLCGDAERELTFAVLTFRDAFYEGCLAAPRRWNDYADVPYMDETSGKGRRTLQDRRTAT